jgi:hypothetical protein
MIVAVGAAWERVAIDCIWFYGQQTILGPRLLGIPAEEWCYHAIDALLVGIISLIAARRLPHRDERLIFTAGTEHEPAPWLPPYLLRHAGRHRRRGGWATRRWRTCR